MKDLPPRYTDRGIVKVVGDPISTLWAELMGRYAHAQDLREREPDCARWERVEGEADGIAAAISVLRCVPIEKVIEEADQRYLG